MTLGTKPGTESDATIRQHIPPAVISERRGITADWFCLITTFASRSKRISKESSYQLESGNGSRDRPALSSAPASRAYVDYLQGAFPLPKYSYSKGTVFMRWHVLSSYRKIFALILLLNVSTQIVFLSKVWKHTTNTTSGDAALAASCNFCVGVLFRNEHVVNTAFVIACATPHAVPLWIRRRIAKVYCYGGVHSGCNISGTLWYLIFWALFTKEYQGSVLSDTMLSVTTGIILAFLGTMVTFAYPSMRRKYHNCFEMTHRFLGWATILCFWAQTVLLNLMQASKMHQSRLLVLVSSPTLWFLTIITLCICYSWTRLRLRRVQAERLSSQAVRLRFDYARMDTCYGIRLADCPLVETHSFATIPNPGQGKGFSVLISAAGDWTRNVIDAPPKHIWIRGAPIIGVARIALMFRKVVMIATGTGIGPCLSFLQARPDYPSRVLWSARKPAETYDSETVDSVLRADPSAVILDSQLTGRCDLLALAFGLFKESNAEAVIVISNPTVVREVIGGLECRGVPAYGPIFDS